MTERNAPSSRVAWGLGIAIGLLLLGGIVLRQTAPVPDPVSAAGREASAIEVASFEVRGELRRDRALLPAVLEAKRSVRLASETEGRVLELGAEALDRVDAELVLVQVDPLRARVAVDRARAALKRATSEYGLAQTSLERQRSLKDRAVTSESALDDANNRSRVADAEIRDARAQLEEARDTLAKKTIRAPFAGVLRRFDVELGEYVRAGQELGEILDLASARATVGLSDRQIVSVRAGESATIALEAHPNRSFTGTILRVGAAADASKKFPVEIEFDNTERLLMPGMVGRVQLDLSDARQRLLVPREALASEYGQRFVYVLEAGGDGTVSRRRPVTVRDLPFDPGRVEVSEGLREGERIAVSGVRLLSDGARVRTRVLAGAPPPPASPSATPAATQRPAEDAS
jgi:membrane fusion protein (multidrug efflux system)